MLAPHGIARPLSTAPIEFPIPQTLIHVLNNVLRFGMTPQQAVEAPRWRVFGSGRLAVEPGLGNEVRAEFAR